MHKGMNTTVDEGQTPIVTTGGFFDEETCFKPSHFTRGKDGKPSDVTPPLSDDADKGDPDTVVCATGQRTHALTTRAACEEDGTGRGNPIIPARAVGFNWQNGGGYGKANDGLGITEEGTGPLQRCNTPAVAYVKATNPHSKEEAPRYEEAAVSACLNGCDERHDPPKHMVACNVYGGNRRKDRPNGGFYVETDADSTKTLDSSSGLNPAASQGGVAILTEPSTTETCQNGSDERHDPPKHMVAFAQNQPGEVRCNSEVMGTVNTNQNASGRNTPMVMHECVAFKPGQSEAAGGTFVTEEFAPTMQAQNNGSTAVPAVAFANRTRDGIKVPEIMKDGVVPALTNPGGGVRADAVNVCLPAPQGDQSIAFNAYQRTEGTATWPIGASDGRKVEVGVRSGMQVRRLTPSECEYLQGFPSGHTDITFRKKPAADGPRYRALGNSMAVPCMVWLGHRIQQATKGDNT